MVIIKKRWEREFLGKTAWLNQFIPSGLFEPPSPDGHTLSRNINREIPGVLLSRSDIPAPKHPHSEHLFVLHGFYMLFYRFLPSRFDLICTRPAES